MSGDGEFDWRSITPTDAKALAGLIAAISEADQDWEYFSEQDLLEDFSDPYHDFARGSVCVFDGDVMVGYCTLTCRNTADPVHAMRHRGGVHPAYRRRGLGGQLLDWADRTAIPLHEERYPGRPLTLTGECLSHNAGAIALFGQQGYHPARWFHAMERDLTVAIPDVPVPPDVQIMGFTPEHIGDGLLIRNESFRDHWGSLEQTAQEWARTMEYEAFRPALSFLAYDGQEPLGLIISHEYEADTAASGIRDVYIALIGTRRQARKRGVATALVVQVLTAARAAGFTAASLSVDADSLTGALDLYKRVGFTVRHTAIAQTKPLLPASSPPN